MHDSTAAGVAARQVAELLATLDEVRQVAELLADDEQQVLRVVGRHLLRVADRCAGLPSLRLHDAESGSLPCTGSDPCPGGRDHPGRTAVEIEHERRTGDHTMTDIDVTLLVLRLHRVAIGIDQHTYMGSCPDALDGHGRRDPECRACRVLIDSDEYLIEHLYPIDRPETTP